MRPEQRSVCAPTDPVGGGHRSRASTVSLFENRSALEASSRETFAAPRGSEASIRR
jgi:hypothetical protein